MSAGVWARVFLAVHLGCSSLFLVQSFIKIHDSIEVLKHLCQMWPIKKKKHLCQMWPLLILKNKVSLQISLEYNPSNLSYIFILSVKFENLTIRLHVFIIFFMLAKFQNFKKIKDQLLCHQTNVKISGFCNIKLCIKNKFIDWIVNNIWIERNLTCILRT